MGSDEPRSDSPLARQILLLQVALVVVLVVVSLLLSAYDARRDARTEATEGSVAVAQTVADSPSVVRAVQRPDPSALLQPYCEEVRHDTQVDFVVVMGLDRARYCHPNPDNIGKPFIGDLGDAPEGDVFTQQYTGTLGPSMRAVVPVEASDGTVVALVSVGITVEHIDSRLRHDLLLILASAAVVLAAGLGGAALVSRRLRRQTHGMGEREITRMYEYYRAVLHAVREGLLLLDDKGRVQLVNDEAIRLLGLPEDPDEVVGTPLADLGLPEELVSAATAGRTEADDVYVVGEHLLVVSSAPASWQGRDVGAVVTLRDHTDLQAVTGELNVVRGLTDALRAQTHEAANRLHTVVSLIELGRPEEAVEFATEELQVAQLLTDKMLESVGEPVIAALLLAKSAQASELGIGLDLGSVRIGEETPVGSRDLVTVLGNLIDNAFDALAGAQTGQAQTRQAQTRQVQTRQVRVAVEQSSDGIHVVVGDSGPGVPSDAVAHVLERGWSTKSASDAVGVRGSGLALVEQVARRHGGHVRVGRSELGGAEFSVDLGATGSHREWR